LLSRIAAGLLPHTFGEAGAHQHAPD
jgi:hypothetical protein